MLKTGNNHIMIKSCEARLEKLVRKIRMERSAKGATEEYNFLGSTSCLDIETNLLYRETRIFHSGQDASGAYIASMKKIFDGRRVGRPMSLTLLNDRHCLWDSLCRVRSREGRCHGNAVTPSNLEGEWVDSTLPYNAWPDNYPAANTWIQTCSLICEITWFTVMPSRFRSENDVACFFFFFSSIIFLF